MNRMVPCVLLRPGARLLCMTLPQSGTLGPKVPFGFIGSWTPPAEYGTLVSSPMVFTEADWTIETPPASNQPASWDFATTVGQVIGGVWFTWGTDIQVAGSPYCAPLAATGSYGQPIAVRAARAPQTGASTGVGNWRVSAPSVNVVGKLCTPSSKPVAPTPAENLAEALSLLQTVQAQIG